MKKILIFFFVLALMLTPIAVTQAQIFDTIVPCTDSCGWNDIVQLGDNILSFLIAFAVVIATIMFTYAGFLYLTAGGNPSRLSKAHSIFINVGIGFIFVLGAFLIVKLILDTFQR
ncbi:MAG: hypothetical protein ISR98_01290 [Parcubacteria group bacterium]|nr:hypothetical protein [Parcubacteria group bacterium]